MRNPVKKQAFLEILEIEEILEIRDRERKESEKRDDSRKRIVENGKRNDFFDS